MTAAALPVLTIGGYLGSGKTTLVNHLLRHADGRRLAILVNEFGDLPIDEDLIEAEGDEMISIAGGCICCSFGNDLMAALRDMTVLEPRPDAVIIESSGVAIPGAIVATLSLLEGVRSDGTIVVVDAETVRKAARDEYIGDTILRQLADAEGVVINKLDLVDCETGDQLSDWLSETAPGAFQLPARFGQVLPEALRTRNEAVLDDCAFEHINEAIAEVEANGEQGSRILVMPGVYREEPYVGAVDPACLEIEPPADDEGGGIGAVWQGAERLRGGQALDLYQAE